MQVPKIAVGIAKQEGFYVEGSLPNRNNNPGDLRHSPHSVHTADAPNAIGKIDSVEHGWEDLVRQLELYVERNAYCTVHDAIYQWAPSTENDTDAYLVFILNYVPCNGSDLLSDVLKIQGDTDDP